MANNSKGTIKRIVGLLFMLLCGIVSVLIGFLIIYLVIFRWFGTEPILGVIGSLFVSLMALVSGSLLIYAAIREAKKSGKDE